MTAAETAPDADEGTSLQDEIDHLDALLARQHAILTGVANALRGDPGPLASHSHHDLAERAASTVAALAVATRSLEAATTGERLTTCDELARLSREVATLRAAYAADLDGLRAEVRRADDERDVRRAETARLTAERDAAHAVITGLREEIVASVGDPAVARMEPMTASALDAACAAEDRAAVDEPLLDGTDGAHPAWWRGHDRAAGMLTAQRDAALADAARLRAALAEAPTVKISSFTLLTPGGTYEAGSIAKLLWLVVSHRLHHLVRGEGWID